MYGALTKVSPLKPAIRLAQAVSEFEADLSGEQKVEFRTLRLHSCKDAPNTIDVMRLTAEMDRRITNKFGSQCFGPRFTNILQGVQQFAALGDVVVGGSQSLVACGVWSVVRMSLLSFVSLSTYIDRLSSLFMAIGRTAPRYQAMALLYPRSKMLQTSLMEYFILVVNLCHYLFKFAQKSSIRQFTSSLSDSYLKNIQSELEKWADSIKEEMYLAEVQENSTSRAWTRKIHESSSHQLNCATRMRVLNFCSNYDHETAWKQTRKAGNSSFHKRQAEYQKWKECSHSCTLVYVGKLGSGKSVLLANIVDDLNLSTDKDQSIVAYFFCKHDIRESLQARTILGSLIRQLLHAIPDLAVFASYYEEIHIKDDAEEVLNLLIQVFPPNRKAYIVLDGMDECDYYQKEILAKALYNIQNKFRIHICVSFREDPNNSSQEIANELLATRIVSLPDDNPDIEAFIETELERCLEKEFLTVGDPTLILEIQDALLKGSQGMFLWVALQIQTLCNAKTDHAIREVLADLPKDLSETFGRILQKSGTDSIFQTKTLQLVLAASRPLTTDELREALSVTPGNATWDDSRLLHNVYSALACCGCLLTVDEEELTVRVVHHSVKQYVLAGHDGTKHTKFSFTDARRTMADIVVTYLSYGVFGTELSRVKIPSVMAQAAPSKIIQATMDSSSNRRSLAIKFLRSRKQLTFDMSKVIAEARSSFQSGKGKHFSFYQYAKTHWKDLILCVSGHTTTMFELASKSIHSRASMVIPTDTDPWLFCESAVENRNEKLLGLLLQVGGLDINSRDGTGQTMLTRAISFNHKDLVQVLLGLDKVDVNTRDLSGTTALRLAVLRGYTDIVEMLIFTGKVSLDETEQLKTHLLALAASNGSASLIEVLLETGEIDVNAKDFDGLTPLMHAASNGREDTAKVLLETGNADLNTWDDDEHTALMHAVSKEHKDVLEVLLATKRVNLSATTDIGETPLMLASWGGYKDVVKVLLKTSGVEVDAKASDGNTALMCAAWEGHTEVVKMLLYTGKAGVDEKDNIGNTALSYAAFKGHKNVVEVLVDLGGADVNVRNNDGQTPLIIAVSKGYIDVVEVLVATGNACLNVRDNFGSTAMVLAALRRGKDMMRVLQSHDDSINVESHPQEIVFKRLADR